MVPLIVDRRGNIKFHAPRLPPGNCCSFSLPLSTWLIPLSNLCMFFYRYLKKSSGGDEYDGNATSVFNDDGTIKDSELRIVNLNNDHEWEEVIHNLITNA